MAVGREVARVVVDDAVGRGDFVAADLADLVVGRGAVQSGGDQDGDPLARNAGLLQAAQDGRKRRRFGAGRVMSQTEMAALCLPRASSARGGAPIGLVESGFESGLPVGQRGGASGPPGRGSGSRPGR